jgi:hypothetical protein
MTIHHFKVKGEEDAEGRDYLLEINPNYTNRSRTDMLNVIDARWVDVSSGLFIDVTAIYPNMTAPEPGVLSCKDRHDSYAKDIFPLRESTFEGVAVKVPYNYKAVLEEEYTKSSLTRIYYAKYVSSLLVKQKRLTFSRHRFNQTTLLWEPISRIDSRSLPITSNRTSPNPIQKR